MWGAFFSADTHSPMTPQTFISREHCIAAIHPQADGQHTLFNPSGAVSLWGNVKPRSMNQHALTSMVALKAIWNSLRWSLANTRW
jgi:hypothetical protein